MQKDLRRRIREGKDCYRRKMEDELQSNNISEVWRGLKTISGHRGEVSQVTGDQGWVNDLNLFFNRFDQSPVPPPAQKARLQHSSLASPGSCQPPSLTIDAIPSTQPPPTSLTDNSTPPESESPPTQIPSSSLSLTTVQVRKELRRIKRRKAAGPDGVSARILKSCADQLCGIVEHVFNLSLKLGRVPLLWKTSCVVPVSKTSHAMDLSSFRLVALTTHLMKTLEKLVLAHLCPLVRLPIYAHW